MKTNFYDSTLHHLLYYCSAQYGQAHFDDLYIMANYLIVTQYVTVKHTKWTVKHTKCTVKHTMCNS